MTTTGPGLYELGVYYDLNTFATFVCFMLMMIGRLEAVMFVILLIPEFWRDLFSDTIGFKSIIDGRHLRFLSRLGYLVRRR